jgi:putative phage-type endonuclease
MTKTATAQQFTADERRQYLGASEVAAVMGLDRYSTPLDVYNRKLGLVAPFEGNKHTERGNRLEAIAAEYFTEQTGLKLQRRSKPYKDAFGIIVGHVDRVVVGYGQLVEIKCPSVAAFRRFQREGLPESYVIQAQVYMHLGAFPLLTYVIFCADLWDAAIFDIKYDKGLAETATLAGRNFWLRNVQTKTPPEPVKEDAEKLEIAKVGGQDITLRDDEPFIESAQKLREAIELKADAEALFEMAKQDVINRIEAVPGTYQGGGMTLHYKEQAGRVTFDKKALAATHPELDLSRFEKQGKGFLTFRPFFI